MCFAKQHSGNVKDIEEKIHPFAITKIPNSYEQNDVFDILLHKAILRSG